VSERLQVPRGTYDVLPDDADARVALEKIAQRILGGAGYGRIETPAFEYTDVFARGVGESTDIVQKEMYTFDDGGGRSVTLRPEGTAPICRAYAEHGMHKLAQPVKVWYLGQFFRYERAQAGRYRQFWQIGVEALGSDDPAVDAEIIALLATLLAELEVGGLRLRIASLGTPATRETYRQELQDYLRANADRLGADLPELAEAAGLRLLLAEERAEVPELDRLRLLVHAVLEVGADDRRGALGAQRHGAPARVVEGVHLLLDDVGRLADAAREELGVLEDRRLDPPVARGREDPARGLLDRAARGIVLRQHVVRAARRLGPVAHRLARSVRKGLAARSRPRVVMPMWPGWTVVSSG
jgi:hypothetical protein